MKMTDTERDAKLLRKLAEILFYVEFSGRLRTDCFNKILSEESKRKWDDMVNLLGIWPIVLAERERVRKETIEECAQAVDTTEGESVDEMVRKEIRALADRS